MLALTETWLTSSDTVAAGDITPQGYSLHHVPRNGRRGGGIAVIYRAGFSLRTDVGHPVTTTFESTSVLIHNVTSSFRLVVVYRPPRSKKNAHTFTDFLSELTDVIDRIATDQPNLLLVGDFNIHVDDADCREARLFRDCLSGYNLAQHVTMATHRLGHTLDLIITRPDDGVVGDVRTCDLGLSDHLAVTCSFQFQRPPALRKCILQRHFKRMDIAQVSHDLTGALESLSPASDAASTVAYYNDMLSSLLNKHVPMKKQTVTIRPNTAWYSDDLRLAKKERKALERRWRKSKLEVDRQIYCAKRQQVNAMLRAAKHAYYSKMVEDNSYNSKSLFNVIDRLLHRDRQSPLPASDSPERLATDFSDFFSSRIETIRSSLCKAVGSGPSGDAMSVASVLSHFRPTTENEIHKLLMSSPCKSCELDPFPTWLLKMCAGPTLPVLTRLVNTSLAEGYVDSSLKVARIRPLLKKSGMDANILKNFRPVSNLPFVSKLLERVVAIRLLEHMDGHALHEPFQSAYKPHHSVESTLIRVHSDILRALDRQRVVILVLLDLSAAFDTIDHQVLLRRLSCTLGVTGTALRWFQSYLGDRTQSVTVHSACSAPRRLQYGVPQGSVLGPMLFSVYTAPLGKIIGAHGLHYHFYADDTQLYFSFNPAEANSDDVVGRIVRCVADIQHWMDNNFLKLNGEKTEAILFGSPQQLKKVPTMRIPIGDISIIPSYSVRNLGVIQDCNMTMSAHINRVSSCAYLHLRNISRIRPFLSQATTERLVHAFVTSRLDMCNALLFGITHAQLGRLQRIQNCAARLVAKAGRAEHVSPIIQQLHWLPVKQRIIYKVLLQVYRALNNSAPGYISALLQRNTSALRSTSQGLLVVPRTYTAWGDRSFHTAAPRLWNALPAGLRQSESLASFKAALKTHLFKHTCI